MPVAPPLPSWHLTAHPWAPLHAERDAYLDAVERVCRHIAGFQDADGAIIDPFLECEHQYSTPYFAFAVGVLLHAGRADDLLLQGMEAMEHATLTLEKGNDAMPEQHGEFYLGVLAEALPLYKPRVSDTTFSLWRKRMQAPLSRIIEGGDAKTNNWRAYAMRGEWLRAKGGLAQPGAAVQFVEDAWHNRTQRVRIVLDKWSLYQDWSSAPQSHAVEAVGRVNLLGLAHSGYDGPSAGEISLHAERGTAVSLLLQDPTGQCPPNGRTDNHVFNDILYLLAFEMMAEQSAAAGDLHRAGQYRRAAMLGFQSIQRWVRTDSPFEGAYSITKNHFPINERVGYQPASNWTNYGGAVMVHLAEAWLTRKTDIAEQPAPTEIGGFAVAMDPAFGSAVANAGGMQVFINLRGDVMPKYGSFWTPLGIVRLSRVGWDSRLGPSDGIYTREARGGITLAPEWMQGQRWNRLSEHAVNYRGDFEVAFAHPLLVRCTIVYHQETGVSGPAFYQELTITPDGVLSRLRATGAEAFGLTLPLLQNDGRELLVALDGNVASVAYPPETGNGDTQCFIALDQEGVLEAAGDAILSAYGYLLPVRQTAPGDVITTFIYPRTQDDPPAAVVRDSYTPLEDGFSTMLGRVEGRLYWGRHAAGGYGDALDMDGDGAPDVKFPQPCGFIVRHDAGRVTAVESDCDTSVELHGHTYELTAHTPMFLE